MSDFLENKMVNTRKPHNCWGCAREFPAGFDLMYVKTVDEGEFWSGYYCSTCISIMTHCGSDYSDGISYGDFRLQDKDWWREMLAKYPTEV